MLDEYRKPEEDKDEYTYTNPNFKSIPFIDIDEDEIPF